MKKNYLARGVRKLFRKSLHTPLVIVGLLLGSLYSLQAQKMERMSVDPIVCPATFKDANSRMAMRQLTSKNFQSTNKNAVTADIIITFGPGAEGNAEVQAAFEFAIGIWAQEIVSSVPIRISADFADLGAGVLASAGPTTLVNNFPGAPEADTFYPIALANSLAGEDLAPDLEFDLVVNLGNGLPFFFGTDGNTPAGQFDFVTIALHEMGHGLGFIDGGNVNGAGVGNINGGGNPFIFDTFVVDSQGNSVLDIANPSTELGDFYTSGDVFANGQFAVEALNGVLPELFAPNPFQGGSSIAHWDEAAFPAGDPNSLMSPQVGTAESNFNIGDITRGHFRDMGWVLAEQSPVTVLPANVSEILNVGETLIVDLTVNNITDVAANVIVSASQGAQVIGAINPEAFTLAADSSTVITVELTAVNAQAGVFDEVLIFTVEGSDLTFEVPVSVRVLDGTEAPILEVLPTAFDETIGQFEVVTRDLLISNPGSADLNFNITVNGEAQQTFNSRAAIFTSNIAKQGFTSEKFSSSNTTGLSSLIQNNGGTFERATSTILATGFEDFALGELTGQLGWAAQPAGFFTVSADAAFEGSQGVRGTPDGSGATGLAFSPAIVPGNQPFMTASAQVRIEGNDTSFELIPQSNTAASVNTRVRFNADGSIDVLDASIGAFVSTGATRPEGFFNVRISIDRDDSSLLVFIDDELIHSGTGFAPLIEQIVFFSDNAGTATTIDVDNLEVTDGDDDIFFLSVSPISGNVPFGESLTAAVRFDARALVPGEYTATINITSDDPNNASLDVPVTLTVTAPAAIEVNPLEVNAAVNVEIDNPAIDEQTITITNNGGSPLEFDAQIGLSVFTAPTNNNQANLLANLNRSIYGGGSSNLSADDLSISKNESNLNKAKITRIGENLANTTQVVDSLFLDTGVDFPPTFVGFGAGGPGISAGVQFTVPNEEFVLTAVRNGVTTEDFGSANILLQVYLGGATPDQGELLLEQVVTQDSPDGAFALETLSRPLRFTQGQSFWIVHNYPTGIDFPQGFDDNVVTTAPGAYAFTGDGGITFATIDGFAFLTRALSTVEDFITLSPTSGTVQPGEQIELTAAFDGSNLSNGTYESDIVISSNDPLNSEITVPTTFEVSGQTSGILVSEELLLFNDVFLGNSAVRSFTVTNTGVNNLNISEITSDNEEFTVSQTTANLIAGEQLQIDIIYTPVATGSSNGVISVISDGGEPIDIIVNGVGIVGPFAVLSPEENQATVASGSSVEAEITLRNDGQSPLTYSFPEFAVANALADPNAVFQKTEVIDFPNFSRNQPKGFEDSRIGAPVSSVMGTDITFGYTWIDSDAPGGPVNGFFDITDPSLGTDITAALIDGGGFSDGTISFPMPFAFPFYGTDNETLFVNGNGFVAFEAPTGLTFINGQIPEEDGNNNIIAPFWADLEAGIGNGGTVHAALFADAVIVQWTDAPAFVGTGSVTFQVILFSDGTIDVNYQDVATASFVGDATIGIENTGATDGAQVAFNTAFVRDDFAIRFIPPAAAGVDFITSALPLSGILGVGQEETITVTLDASNLEPGIYLDQLMVSSNSPDMSRSTATFELEVLEIPEIVSFLLINADTNEVIGTLSEGDVIDLATSTTSNFNVVANPGNLPIGSVIFDLNGEIGFQTENIMPYALAGDNNGIFEAITFPLGTNTITATPFSEANGGGTASRSLTVTFEVIDTTTPEILGLTLVNADTNEAIGPINNGDIINFNTIGTSNLTIVANGDDTVGSVIFDYNGDVNIQTENIAPYALGGDNNGDFEAFAFVLGENTVTANPFTEASGGGNVGIPTTITFTVVEGTPEVSGFALVNADSDETIGAILDGDIVDLANFERASLNIIALIDSENVGSVIFDFNDIISFNTENLTPYALSGDNEGDFLATNFSLGSNTVTATIFTESNGSGEIVGTATITFEVIDSNITEATTAGRISPNPVENVAQFSMENGDKQVLQGVIVNLSGQVVSPSFDVDINDQGQGYMDVSTLSQGIYILRLTDASGKIVSQIKMVKN